MPKLKPEELETRRRDIIDAAGDCFLRSGFHNTTTDEICRKANIAPGGLYHYFESKEDLITAVIDRSGQAAVDRVRNLIAEATSAESAFRSAGSFFFETMQGDEIDNATRLELEIWVEGLKNAKLFDKSKTAWAMRIEWLETLVSRGIEEGIYDAEVVKPRAMASLLIAVWLGLRLGRLMGEEFDLSGALRSLTLMHGGQLQTGIPAPTSSQSV